jgi:hypothetical protein
MMVKEHPSRSERRTISIGEMLVKCQSDAGDLAEASFSKAPRASSRTTASPLAMPSSAATSTPAGVPFAAFLDQQWRAAVASGSRAIVPQQQPAGGISRSSDNAALGIPHQDERMVQLIAA